MRRFYFSLEPQRWCIQKKEKIVPTAWVKIGPSIDIPDGSIQTIAYMTDLPKIEQCKYMIPNYDGIEKYDKAKYEKNGPSFPQGFKQNETKYIVTFWNRTDG